MGDFTYPDVWNLTPVPVSEGGVALNVARTWAVLAGSENPDAAALILRYIADTENLVAAAGNGSVPMRQTEAINDPRLQRVLALLHRRGQGGLSEQHSDPSRRERRRGRGRSGADVRRDCRRDREDG